VQRVENVKQNKKKFEVASIIFLCV